MKQKIVTLIVILIVFLPLIGIQAQIFQPFTLTPFFGGYGFEGNRNIGKSIVAGLGVGFSLSDQIMAELIYLRGDFDINYYDQTMNNCMTSDGIDTNIIHIGGHYHLFKYNNWTPFVAGGLGIIHMDSDYADTFRNHPERHYEFQFNYGAGLKYSISKDIAIRWDIRHMLTPRHMDNDISATIGLSYSFGLDTGRQTSKVNVKQQYLSSQITKQSKNQGVHIQVSQQNVSETTSLDTDHDGILDAKDICPKTAPAVKVDASGCPIDSDKDGIFDGIDRCPETPEDVAVNIFGCSVDSDRDGIIDVRDQCANTPFEMPVDSKGCPVDKDKDGVPDPFDQCPDTIFGKLVDIKGCAILTKTLKTFHMKIEFDYKSAEVRTKYHNELEEAARSMIRYQKAIAIIESHTDNIGSDAYNINLSNERAESVKHYLNHHFHIPFHRMKTFGFGESKPIADNNTETGRQKNRRVEIIISEKITH